MPLTLRQTQKYFISLFMEENKKFYLSDKIALLFNTEVFQTIIDFLLILNFVIKLILNTPVGPISDQQEYLLL